MEVPRSLSLVRKEIFGWAECQNGVPVVDLLSRIRKPFQGPIPDVSTYFGPIHQSSIVLIPHEAKHWDVEYKKYVLEMTKHHIVLCFNRGDFPLKLRHPKLISIQVAKNLGWKTPAIIVPYNIESLDHLPYREHAKRPYVSFVGYVPKLSPGRIFKSGFGIILHPIKSQGSITRQVGCSILKSGNGFETYLRRRKVYGGIPGLHPNPDILRSEFIQSIFGSDYVFTPRGDANSSRRLYEVLSAGRIPVIPRTGTLLPKLPQTNNEFNFVSIASSSRDLRKVVLENWTSLTNSEYFDIQKNLRRTYKEVFDYRNFMHKFFSINDSSELFGLLQ
jgi:hypothetical protein